ncbi:hypothetical protein J7337_006377 [Fusarium musae]|uniref:Short chain dehydrogenase n=1 Tax=Fusarium musae TaxID=1042133 RepID=A0A9P8DF69_9HYPO|nr:hypothetical protein J7337_006377 [Fusarium musae]KAG9500698.1 hypothetical protein J7337_006377 [Fusarium musae]
MDAFRGQLEHIPIPTTSFQGQTIIVTGSNTGLGLEAARHFVRLDADIVILAVRSLERGEAAKASIEASTKRKNVVQVWQLEMDKYDSIKSFASRCNTLERLDVVVENAGILRNTYEESEGTEITIKVNVIGTFLLALNLFPILRRSYEKTRRVPRLVITSSAVHYNGLPRYLLSIAKTLVARKTEEGSRTLVHSAAAGDESHGKYMSECRVREPSNFVRSKAGAETQARVHKELMAILESIQPGITQNI